MHCMDCKTRSLKEAFATLLLLKHYFVMQLLEHFVEQCKRNFEFVEALNNMILVYHFVLLVVI